MAKLVVATGQFPVGADLRRNARFVLRQMETARERGAHVAHFPECALSGYAPVDMPSYEGFDWDLLRECTERVIERAGELGLWVVVGSSHRLGGRRKPHNSVYVVSDRGRLVDRYDKLFCAWNDLDHYTSGEHFCTFRIRGVRCGVLVCHDYRYPELYREYKKKGVELMFHGYHAGNAPKRRLAMMRGQVGAENVPLNHGGTSLPEITMPATMQAAAASSHVFISCPNTSARHSCFPAFFVRADGVITGKLRRHAAGVLISTVDTGAPLYDSTKDWRGNAMRGVFHSGKLVRDERSRRRREL